MGVNTVPGPVPTCPLQAQDRSATHLLFAFSFRKGSGCLHIVYEQSFILHLGFTEMHLGFT